MAELLLLLHTALPALEGMAVLFLFLSLARLKPVRHWKASLVLLALWGAGCILLDGADIFLVLLPEVLLAAGIVLLLKAPAFYGILLALLTGTVFSVWQMACRLPFFSPWLALAVSLLLCVLCHWRQVRLLPDLSQIPAAGDKKTVRRFSRSLLLVCVACLELQLGVCLLLDRLDRFRIPEQAVILLLTAAGLLTLLLLVRRIAFGAVERMEALIDKQYQTELLNFMQIIRSQRHDFNFHIQAISGMVEGGRYQECREYIHQMTKNATVMNDILPLRDPAVSAMLNSFREMAQQKKIVMDVSIHNDLSRIPCSVYETNTIIGNLIQNAIDEVERHPTDRWINVLILKRGGDIIIKITNPCTRDPSAFKEIFRPGYSTKESHEGIGLTTVQRIVSRCSGTIHPEFDGSDISFVVRLPCLYGTDT